ncbi:MAG: DUF3048 domain-containing protein [Actinomycetota bacterium]|nr:DUF3048 domain-containing protein [Actinomycetota bacterium]
MNKNVGVAAVAALAAIVLALGAGFYINSTNQTADQVIEEEKYYCMACGEEVAEETDATLRPLAVIIENHPDTRPQSGLEDACIVHEVVAEGGITRFLAVYLHDKVDSVGPVRSVRDYYGEMAKGFEAILAHCGGSPAGYKAIKDLKLDDLDEFANTGAYWRSSKHKRPHNLYTSTDNLREKAKERGFEDLATFKPFEFKDDAPTAERPSSMEAKINFSSPEFLVAYEYEMTSNSYLRSMGGKVHRALSSGRQLSVKNVLIQVTSIKVIDEMGRVKVANVGRGLAYALLDGQVIEGKWVRDSLKDSLRFYDITGSEIALNRGPVWIETVSLKDVLSFETEEKAEG